LGIWHFLFPLLSGYFLGVFFATTPAFFATPSAFFATLHAKNATLFLFCINKIF